MGDIISCLSASLTTCPRENQLYKSYNELLWWIPSIFEIPPTDLRDALQQVREIHLLYFCTMELKSIQLGQGADSSRADDTCRLKVLVVNWLMQGTPRPERPLSTEDKTGRGFHNDATGRLLCPVNYNWNDAK